MPEQVDISEFLTLAAKHPVFDVRTPAEFEQGHIPGANNLPLFTNEERAIVGTIYKQIGKNQAVEKGLSFVVPRLFDYVQTVCEAGKEKTILVHCWRGGMRSGSMALLLEKCGYKVYTLKGGYKYFRRFVLSSFEKKYNFIVLGGKTGSSKSKILDSISDHRRNVIHLEKLANHKGSSYGHLGENNQPSQEHFENLLAVELNAVKDGEQIWLEDESRLIGKKVMPGNIYEQMRNSKVVYLDIDFEKRVKHLTEEYGKFDQQALIDATLRIAKRLGPVQTRDSIKAIEENRMEDACRIILHYYDKTYSHGLSKRESAQVIMVTDFKSALDLLNLV